MYFENLGRAFRSLVRSRSLREFIVNLDKAGNALCGGWYWATISARVGYFVLHKSNPYWQLLRKVIDETFRPIDGPNHCVEAYRFEQRFTMYRRGSDVALVFLGVVVIAGCLVLMPIVWMFSKFDRAGV